MAQGKGSSSTAGNPRLSIERNRQREIVANVRDTLRSSAGERFADSWIGIGDGVGAATRGDKQKKKAPRSHGAFSLAGLRLQLHVERRRVAAADLNVGEVSDETRLSNLNVVPAFRQIDQQSILACPAPRRAVHEHFGITRVDAE